MADVGSQSLQPQHLGIGQEGAQSQAGIGNTGRRLIRLHNIGKGQNKKRKGEDKDSE
jgi:hypothetical protein